MEVHFSPDQEDRLKRVADRTGKSITQVVEGAVDWVLEYDARLRDVLEGDRASDSG